MKTRKILLLSALLRGFYQGLISKGIQPDDEFVSLDDLNSLVDIVVKND